MGEALEYWFKRRMGRRRALFAACVTVCAVICAALAWGVPGASAQENTRSTAIPDNTSTVWVDVEGTSAADAGLSGRLFGQDLDFKTSAEGVTAIASVDSSVWGVGAHQAPYMYNAHKVVSRSASGVSPVRLDVLNDPGEEFASVAFSNGSDTIAVPGEGTWTIGWDAENGLLEATFTPEAGFSGVETTHVPYTVTNASGLSDTGELWVKYVS